MKLYEVRISTSFRLLDICHGQRMDREMVLYLVFEHMDQVVMMVMVKESC